MKDLIYFNQINPRNKNLVGNKAFRLAELAKVGIRIANFFIIPSPVFDKILENKELQSLKADLIFYGKSNLDKNLAKELEILKEINLAISRFKFPQRFQKQILKSFDKLNTDKVAIRSSATCEDQANSSFAGQFESYLSVLKDQVFEAIEKCFQSVFKEQVLMYCLYHKVDFSAIKMAVIVQKMIKAEKGGVIFTNDVFEGSNNLVIEATKGLGENVVSGRVNSQRIIFSKIDKRPIEGVIGFEKPVLSLKEAKKFFQIGLKVEKVFKQPQDIEWAVKKDKIYILQSRPIT